MNLQAGHGRDDHLQPRLINSPRCLKPELSSGEILNDIYESHSIPYFVWLELYVEICPTAVMPRSQGGPYASNRHSNVDSKTVLLRESVDSNNLTTIDIQIARTVAKVSEKGITDLTPLYQSVDGDALSELLKCDSHISVTFRFEGFLVEILLNQEIEILVREG